jgi:predicted TIM-barrel fold metal-dependent hydrolase
MFMFIDADSHLYTSDFFNDFDDDNFANQYRQGAQAVLGSFPKHQEFLTQQGIDRQLINYGGIATGMKYRLPTEVGVKVMKYYNSKLKEIVEQDPRFDINLWLALQSPEDCLNEIERTKSWKIFGCHFNDTVPWAIMPDYETVLARMAELRIPVYLHIGGLYDFPSDCINIDANYTQLKEQWPDPKDAWLTCIGTFITSGLLDRYTDLRIVVAERDINWIGELREFMLGKGMPDPLPYFKRNFWFTTEPEMPTFLSNAELLGWDRLLFATDYPHYTTDMGGTNQYKDVDTIKELPISASNIDLLTSQNYLKLLNRT